MSEVLQYIEDILGGVILRCYKCNYVWLYRGNRTKKVCCPNCQNQINKKEAMQQIDDEIFTFQLRKV